MTHYYYYIETGEQLTTDARFYRVGIGSSKQADRDFLFLLAYSTTHGHFFKKDCPDVSDFILRCAESLYDGCSGNSMLNLPIQQCKARDLVRLFKTGERISLNVIEPRNRHHLRLNIDSSYHTFCEISRRSQKHAERET